ncbi:MAG TPA: hypothetical protein V6C72_00610 [Chroococcales cyanobacterium]
MITEPIEITLLVIEALEKLGINYLLTGSLAGSLYGNPRSTRDADLLVDFKSEHAKPLLKLLEPDFNLSIESIEMALKNKSSFNAIHWNALFKVDLFLPNNRFDQQELRRRSLRVLNSDPLKKAYVASVEDLILAKLVWYRQGSEVSDQQWSDIKTLYRINEIQLDIDYLNRTSEELGVHDLLQQVNS